MTDLEKSRIARVNEVSAMARTSWITLLAYLGFVGVTLLGVEDADFFVPSRQTQLPLVNVSIPTESFFFFAPILAAALYIYLHIVLLKLWDAIADIEGAEIDGQPLGEYFNPWLVNDWALTRRGGAFTPPRPLLAMGNWASFLLVWAAGPATLVGFWWRSMPAHDEGLTLLLGLCLLVAAYAGVTSWRAAHAALADPRRNLAGSFRRGAGWTVLALGVAAISWLRTEGGFDYTAERLAAFSNDKLGTRYFAACDQPGANKEPIAPEKQVNCNFPNGDPKAPIDIQRERIAKTSWIPKLDWFEFDHEHWLAWIWVDEGETWTPLAATDLGGVELVDLPPDWRAPETARAAFRKTWCEREGVSMVVCDHLPSAARPAPPMRDAARHAWCAGYAEAPQDDCLAWLVGLDERFEDDWREERAAARANLPKLALAGRDLRNVFAADATLVGAILSEARLEGANLYGTRLEGANLSFAALEGANLILAQLEDAILYGSQLGGAELFRARLEGADLSGTRLEFANLGEARLARTILKEARLEEAHLGGAWLYAADLRYADFRGSSWAGASILASPVHFTDLRTDQYLTQAQLENLIGNNGTLLPDRPNENGEPYFVWSCWETQPDGFEGMVDRIAFRLPEYLSPGEVRDQFLCGPDNPHRRVGTPLALGAPYPDGHPLAGRD